MVIFVNEAVLRVKEVHPACLKVSKLYNFQLSARRVIGLGGCLTEKYICHVTDYGFAPPLRQVVVHFSMPSSFSTSATISRRSSTPASSSVMASAARACGSGGLPLFFTGLFLCPG